MAFRELLLIKIAVGGAERRQIVDLCTLFKAKAIDINADSIMLELTGSTDKVDNFIKNLSVYPILEMARTGGAALERGGGSMAREAEAAEKQPEG